MDTSLPAVRVSVQEVDDWNGTWVTNKALRITEKYGVKTRIDVSPTERSLALEVIFIPLAIYAGKKAIDLVFKEIERYLENRNRKLMEKQEREIRYQISYVK